MTDPIDAAEQCRLQTPMDVAVSPDGTQVAFTTTEWDQSSDEQVNGLYVAPTDGTAPPHRLTRGSGAGSPRWSPDGSTLGFIATREEDDARRIGPSEEDADEDDEPEAQVWAFDLERGGDARQLTDREWGVREFDWGPDGERLVISARDPTDDEEAYLERLEDDGPIEIERLQHKLDGVGFTDEVTTYLFVVDLETGSTTRLEETAASGAFEQMAGVNPAWQPGGEQIAFLNATGARTDDTMAREVHLVEVDSGDITVLTNLDAVCSPPAWSPSGDQLVVHTRDAVNWYLPMEIRVLDPAEGSMTTLTEGLDATVSWFGSPRFLDDETVIAGMGDAGRTRLYRFATDGSRAEVVDLGFDDDHASLRATDTAGGTIGYVVSDPSSGDDVFAIEGDLDAGATRQLSSMNEAFFEDHPGPGILRLSTEHDGITVESMVYHPPSFDPSDPEAHPTIIWPHGGPMSYDDPEYMFAFAYFTSRGYLVVKPNYRGSTSYGADFGDVLNGRWGTADVADTLAVVDDCIDRGWTDERRLFSAGFSYGGILTGFLVTQSDRFTAAAAEHGIYDIRSEFGTSDSHNWMGNEFGLPWEEPEAYDAASSILDVGGVETPTLVAAGAEDWRCPPTQSEQFFVALRKQGTSAKLVVYPGEHHNISTPERAIHRLETIADWFERHDPTVETA